MGVVVVLGVAGNQKKGPQLAPLEKVRFSPQRRVKVRNIERHAP